MKENKLRSVIVEDEKHSRETLIELIGNFIDGIEVSGSAGSVNEAISLIKEVDPDVVFLDIELQTGTGFDVLSALNDMNFEVIFTTAFEHYALKAIKFSSIDYLLKPIDLEELQGAVNKVIKKQDTPKLSGQLEILMQNLNANNKPEKICLSTSEGYEFIKLENIIMCEAQGSYTKFYLTDNINHLVSKNLKEYENLLTDQRFMRVHNSFLINLEQVKRYVKADGGYILMDNDFQVSVSPKKKEEFLIKMNS